MTTTNTTTTRDLGRVARLIQLSPNDDVLIEPTRPIAALLPIAARSAPDVGTIRVAVKPGAIGTVQLRDDAGRPVGRPLAAGQAASCNLHVDGSAATWVLR